MMSLKLEKIPCSLTLSFYSSQCHWIKEIDNLFTWQEKEIHSLGFCIYFSSPGNTLCIYQYLMCYYLALFQHIGCTGVLDLTWAFFVSSRDFSTWLRSGEKRKKKREHSSILILLQISISVLISLVAAHFCYGTFAEKSRWVPTLEWKGGDYREWIPAMQLIGGLQGKKNSFMIVPSIGHWKLYFSCLFCLPLHH